MRPPDRNGIRRIVREATEPIDWIHALWEGGSAAFSRDDVWSDVDLQLCVNDDRLEDAFGVVEAALTKRFAIEDRFIMPEPTWHGHAQRFYRFKDAAPTLMLDLCAQQLSSKKRFLETEVHGNAVFIFDKSGISRETRPLDPAAWEKRLRGRLEDLRARTKMFAILVEKEGRRRRSLDALTFYNGLILAPLTELLRIKHDPWRHHFGLRYLQEVLPQHVHRKLERLAFVRDLSDLQVKQSVALRWFESLATELGKRSSLLPEKSD